MSGSGSSASKRQKHRLPVVGIGASAGGVEALQKLFTALPADLGLAYVVIVHLAPDRDSDLPAILSRRTSMPVIQVTDHETCKLKADHVYVIGPDRKLEITDSSIGASRFEQPRGQRAAIDLFLRSLADSNRGSFAILLSGGGSDGAAGAKAIKGAGGLVLVQSPEEAAHEAMPRAVIATGDADVIAPVEELAHRLSVLARSKGEIEALFRDTNGRPGIDEAAESDYRKVLEILQRRTGHDFSKYKRNTVIRRLGRRMQLSHRLTIAEYAAYLKENVEEVQALFDDLLISVTTFFRDPEAWAALAEHVIGNLIEQTDINEPIRAWVPGCATGEEAYSLTILLQEEIQRRQIERDFIVFASDVDERALATAREGVYPGTIRTDISEDRLNRFFELHDDHYRVARGLRDHVVFAQHSLLRDPPFSRLHLISCRNLLIYLNRELQQQIVGLFRYACMDRGFLFLGISEQADPDMYRALDKKHRIFEAQASADGARQPLPSLMSVPRGPVRHEREPLPRSPAAEMHIETLEAVAPPSLVVDERWNILHLSNTAGRYLQQRGGPYARQITDVVCPELRDDVHMSLHGAFENPEPQLSSFVAVQINGTSRRVAVLAQAHRQTEAGRATALVTFIDAGEVTAEELPDPADEGGEVIRELREKLRLAELRISNMRDDRHLANEDLRAANEELQSLNEEYRSTTEELETSKEELQSVNEELQTVNTELKDKLEEISRAHDDLENLMAATNIPTLFLSRELGINRFTPQLARIFSITPRDYGRPIGDFSHSLDYVSLEEDARTVLASSTPVQRQVQEKSGRTYALRMAPYRTSEDHIDGLVLTFVDVTDLLKVESDLRKSAEQFRALVEASDQVVWSADRQGRHNEDSPSWRAFTGQTEEQWASDWLDAVHPDDRALATAGWKHAVERQSTYASEFRVLHASSGEYRWTMVRAVPLKEPSGEIRGWVGMHTDITERRNAEEALRETDSKKDEFLAILSHELRNPLSAIRNSVVSMGLASGGKTKLDAPWGVVDRQSRHMTRLVNDLLDIVRLERGKVRLQSSRINLLDCIRDTLQSTEQQCKAENLKLTQELPDKPLNVEADPERTVQVLDNLLRNAITYTGAGGEIRVSAFERDGRAVVTVADNGIGIEPDELNQLFDPYRQVNPGKRGSGLGLGLTLVKRLMELQDGTVAARSDGIGAGSEFEISLPLVAAAHAAPQPSMPSMPSRRRRVLVVDDEADVADAFAALLQVYGQDVTVANSGPEALTCAESNPPEVAFIDLSMPVMDGEELARQLRQSHPAGLHIVALSGFGIEQRTTSEVFDNHLLKPASLDAIIGVLNALPEGEEHQPSAGE